MDRDTSAERWSIKGTNKQGPKTAIGEFSRHTMQAHRLCGEQRARDHDQHRAFDKHPSSSHGNPANHALKTLPLVSSSRPRQRCLSQTSRSPDRDHRSRVNDNPNTGTHENCYTPLRERVLSMFNRPSARISIVYDAPSGATVAKDRESNGTIAPSANRPTAPTNGSSLAN